MNVVPRWLSIEWFVEFNEILKHLLRYDVKTVLDVGCGACVSCVLLETLGIRCIGIDTDCTKANCVCIEHDIRKPLPFADDTFDAVISQHVIEHIEKEYQERAIREMVRVARKIVVVITPNRDFYRAYGGNEVINDPEHKHVMNLFEAMEMCSKIKNCSVYEMTPFFYASNRYYHDVIKYFVSKHGSEYKPSIVIVVKKRYQR